MSTTPASIAQQITGSTWTTDETGGGCLALVTTLKGGIVLALTDDALTSPAWQDDEDNVMPWALGAYRYGAWFGDDEDRDALASDWHAEPLTPETLRARLTTFLDALPTVLAL